jgi:aldehyde dehydrogenase
MAARVFNEAIHRELGIENLACIVEPPTSNPSTPSPRTSSQAALRHRRSRRGQGRHADGKRAVCAGPGNPPVLVDGTSCLDNAARCVIRRGAYDNNLLCIGEKEVFVLEPFIDKFMAALEKHGACG